MDVERLRQVLADLSANLVSLQHRINEATQLLETISSAFTTLAPQHGGHSSSGSPSSVPELERRVKELETDKRELTGSLEQLLARHGICEAEINHAVRAREGMIKKYRLLVKVAADLLQRVMEEFPNEEFDDDIRNAVVADLKRQMCSRSRSTSSSSETARPRTRGRHHSKMPVHSLEGHGLHPGPSNLAPGMSFTSSAKSQLSALTEGLVDSDGTPLDWAIHMGSKCPASIKVTAGPFVHEDFIKLGINETELDDLFHSLIYPTDVGIRLAQSPSPPRGFPNVKVVFLYDPFYLESGTRTYILDWVTSASNEEIIHWLRTSGRDAIFHTFTFSRKKNRWYYFGAIRWSLAWNRIWPTLDSGTRAPILEHLSERSHSAVTAEEIEQQMETGQLQELSIEIAPVNERSTVEAIAAMLGKSLREVKFKKPIVVRGEQ